MKSAILPFFTGQLPPVRSIWLPLTPREVETLITEFKKDQTRAWHTASINIYEQVGCGVFVQYSYLPRPAEQAELEAFLNDHR